jgi:hypothetical protein
METERVPVIKAEEDQEERTIPVMKTEPKNCMGFGEGGTGSSSETHVECDVDGTEEVSIKFEEAIDIKDEVSIKVEETIDIKDEIPEAVIFPSTEHEILFQVLNLLWTD